MTNAQRSTLAELEAVMSDILGHDFIETKKQIAEAEGRAYDDRTVAQIAWEESEAA